MRCPSTGLRNNGLYGPANPTLDTFMICSPSGFCWSFSCCIVSCGKRGGFDAGDKSAAIAPNTSHAITAAIREHRSVCLILIPPYCEVSRLRGEVRPSATSAWRMNSSVSSTRRSFANEPGKSDAADPYESKAVRLSLTRPIPGSHLEEATTVIFVMKS